MKEKVFNIVSDIMKWPLKKVNEDSSPENIDTWDSLNQINLVLALEEEFGVSFTDEQIVEMLSVSSVIEVLENIVQ